MKKRVTITLIPGQKFAQEIGAGSFKVTCDLTVAGGGAGLGPDPKDFLLGALGSCTAMTIIGEAPKRKWNLTSVSVTVIRDDEPDPDPNAKGRRPVFTEEIEVKGSLSAAELADIKSVAKKCPVYRDFTHANKRMETNVILVP